MTSLSADCMQSLPNPLHSDLISQLYLPFEFSSSHLLLFLFSPLPLFIPLLRLINPTLPQWGVTAHRQARDRPATQSACLNQPAPNMEEDKQTYTTHFLTQTWLCGPAHSEPCLSACWLRSHPPSKCYNTGSSRESVGPMQPETLQQLLDVLPRKLADTHGALRQKPD